MLEPFSIELGSKKTVTVREFNGVKLVDIREYYTDKKTGKKAPGRKGISLTEPVWRKLIAAAGDINGAIAELKMANKVEQTQQTQDEAQKNPEEGNTKTTVETQ